MQSAETIRPVAAVRIGCETCAFRPGCVTHESEPHNLLRAEICALAGIPFQCHHSDDGEDVSHLHLSAMPKDERVHLRKVLPICEGWKARVKELALKRHFRHGQAQLRRYIGSYALEMLESLITDSDPAERSHAKDELEKSLMILKGGDFA